MDEKIVILMEETGCEQAEAELALQLANYDLEKATRNLRIILRNIVIIKGKFILEQELLYGLFIIIANKRTKEILRLRCAITYNPELYEININTVWDQFERLVHIYRINDGSVLSFANTTEINFLQQIKFKEDMFYYAINKIETELIQDILIDCFSKDKTKMQVTIEEINLEEFTPNRTQTSGKFDTNIPAKRLSKTTDLIKIFLDVTLYEDENGKPAANLTKGETVLAKITDTRDIAKYLIKLLGSKDSQYLSVIIEQTNRLGSEIEFILHFTPGIFGVVKVPADTRIKVIKEELIPKWKKMILTFYDKFAKIIKLKEKIK